MSGTVVKPAAIPLYVTDGITQKYRATLTQETTGITATNGGWYAVTAGHRNHLDIHPDNDEIYFIHRGTATIYFNDVPHPISEGDTVVVPRNVTHYIDNTEGTTDLELFYIFTPPTRRIDGDTISTLFHRAG